MYNLHVVAHTPVGYFEGNVNKKPTTESDALEGRDTLQSNVTDLTHMVIFSGEDETTLPKDVIQNSVLIFSIVEVK